MMHPTFRCVGSLLLLAGAVAAQDQAPPADLQTQLDAIKKQLSDLQTQVQQSNDATAALSKSVGSLQSGEGGDDSFAWGGFADVNLSFQRKAADAGTTAGRTANVAFNPILTYSWRDQWLAAAELNVSQDGLELGQAFIANTSLDHMVLAAGLMPVPFGAYSERYSPSWINKFGELPPIAYNEDFGLFASDLTDLEAQARGECDLGSNRKLNWHLFLSQGPTYASVADGDQRLDFGSNNGPVHHLPTIGFRIGFLPHPGTEVGVSAMTGRIGSKESDPTPNGPDETRTFSSAALDAETRISGFILRGEWVLLDYDAADGTRVQSQAAYLQVSRRMTDLSGWLSGLEPVARVGELHRSVEFDASGARILPFASVHEYGVGVNYYHTSYIRSSLIADAFNGEAHESNRIVLNTTFAF